MSRINGSVGKNQDSYEFYIDTAESNISQINNTSELEANVYLHCIKHNAIRSSSAIGTIIIDETRYTINIGAYNLAPGVTIKLGNAKKTIIHNEDGTKSVSVSAIFDDLAQGSGYGPYSGYASGIVKLSDIPRKGVLKIDSVNSITTSSVKVRYTHVSGMFEHIQYSLNNATWIDSQGNPEITITGLSANTDYSVRVRALNADRTIVGDPSNSISFKTLAKTIPSISLNSKTSTSITVSSSCNVAVSSTQYRIKKNGENYGAYQSSNVFNGLQADTTYIIEVKKIGTENKEEGFATITVTTYKTTVVSASINSKTLNTIKVSYTCNVEVKTVQYRIKKGNESYGNWQNSDTFIGLLTNTNYTVQIGCQASKSGEWGYGTVTTNTYDIARITSISDFEHGNNANINITNPSRKPTKS